MLRSAINFCAEKVDFQHFSAIVAIELYSQALLSGQVELRPEVFQTLAQRQKVSVELMLNSAGKNFIEIHQGKSF